MPVVDNSTMLLYSLGIVRKEKPVEKARVHQWWHFCQVLVCLMKKQECYEMASCYVTPIILSYTTVGLYFWGPIYKMS